MKILIGLILSLFLMASANAASVPRPLKNIKVSATVQQSGEYLVYNYSVSNPSANTSEVFSIAIDVSFDSETEQALPEESLSQCANYVKRASDSNRKNLPSIPVGSDAPPKWSCAYVNPAEFGTAAFHWGAGGIKPGTSTDGFVLKSRGLPTIRKVSVAPWIDVAELPDEYYENSDLTQKLNATNLWTGSTVGPRAPPKALDAAVALSDIKTALTKMIELGWAKSGDAINGIKAKLETAKLDLSKGKKTTARNTLSAAMNEAKAQNGKALTTEGYALLYFNLKYLIEHIN